MIYNSHKQVFSSLHSIFIRCYTDMLTNERNIEFKSPTDQLGRHVMMIVLYITVNGFPTVKFGGFEPTRYTIDFDGFNCG